MIESKDVYINLLRPAVTGVVSFGAWKVLSYSGVMTITPLTIGFAGSTYSIVHTLASKLFNKMFNTDPSKNDYKNSACYITIELSSAAITVLVIHTLGLLTLSTFTAFSSLELLFFLLGVNSLVSSEVFSKTISRFVTTDILGQPEPILPPPSSNAVQSPTPNIRIMNSPPPFTPAPASFQSFPESLNFGSASDLSPGQEILPPLPQMPSDPSQAVSQEPQTYFGFKARFEDGNGVHYFSHIEQADAGHTRAVYINFPAPWAGQNVTINNFGYPEMYKERSGEVLYFSHVDEEQENIPIYLPYRGFWVGQKVTLNPFGVPETFTQDGTELYFSHIENSQGTRRAVYNNCPVPWAGQDIEINALGYPIKFKDMYGNDVYFSHFDKDMNQPIYSSFPQPWSRNINSNNTNAFGCPADYSDSTGDTYIFSSYNRESHIPVYVLDPTRKRSAVSSQTISQTGSSMSASSLTPGGCPALSVASLLLPRVQTSASCSNQISSSPAFAATFSSVSSEISSASSSLSLSSLAAPVSVSVSTPAALSTTLAPATESRVSAIPPFISLTGSSALMFFGVSSSTSAAALASSAQSSNIPSASALPSSTSAPVVSAIASASAQLSSMAAARATSALASASSAPAVQAGSASVITPSTSSAPGALAIKV